MVPFGFSTICFSEFVTLPSSCEWWRILQPHHTARGVSRRGDLVVGFGSRF